MYRPLPISAYLDHAQLTRRDQLPQWSGFRSQYVQIRRSHPNIIKRTLVAVIIWAGTVGIIQNIVHVTQGPWNINVPPTTQVQAFNSPKSSSTLKSAPASVTSAKMLPTGPTGQLLPPGTLAPDRSYANSYARGQCTWYVASRRQIPSNWHNARSWYSKAQAAGWKVGSTPAVAAIAWTSRGWFGHVALVEQISPDGTQIQLSEMNYRGVGVKSTRWVAAKDFKYIY